MTGPGYCSRQKLIHLAIWLTSCRVDLPSFEAVLLLRCEGDIINMYPADSTRVGWRSTGLPPTKPRCPTQLPPSRPSRALPPYLGISVRAEAPRAEPVPAWPYPNSWSGVIALQPVPVRFFLVRT